MKTTILSLFILSVISFAMPAMAQETETTDCSAISDIRGEDVTMTSTSDDDQGQTTTGN